MKKLIAITMAVVMCLTPMTVSAKTMYAQKKAVVYKVGTNKTEKLLTVKKGTKLNRTNYTKKWSRVKINGQVGVVRSNRLGKQKPIKAMYSGSYFRRAGVIHAYGNKYTWYSSRILPGYGLAIPGRHTDEQGFICDKDNYIVLGSNTANRGRIVKTPFGKWGKVYDAGYVSTNWFDCYVCW